MRQIPAAPRRESFTRPVAMHTVPRVAALGLATIAFSALVFSAAPAARGCVDSIAADVAEDDDVAAAVRSLVARMEDESLEDLWKSVSKLKEVGKDAIPTLREALKRAGEKPRLGCARVLLHIGDIDTRGEAIAALLDIVGKTSDKAVKVAAIETLAEHADPEDVVDFLVGVFEKVVDPDVVIPLAKALWDLDSVPEARTRLTKLLDSRDPTVRNAAALALAEIDYFDAKVRNVLRDLRREPTVRGRLAAALYRNDQLHRQFETDLDAGTATLPGADLKAKVESQAQQIREQEQKIKDLERRRPSRLRVAELAVLEEIIDKIERNYVEPKRVDRRKFVIAAAKGVARSLDKYSGFLDPDESKRFQTEISGEYHGIGAQVGKHSEDEPLEILKPIYGGPAAEAGLLTGDLIIEVDGAPTIGSSSSEIVNRLKGPKGTKVRLKVLRRGWQDPREFEIARATVEVPSVVAEMLPLKVGLLKLHQFGERSFEEFQKELLDLERQGMEGLIVDLRNNPGGILDVALGIVDLFVGEAERPIVTQGGRGEEKRSFPTASKRPDYPLVILINNRSASASEIVSGALKDYRRATLVGDRTYGKGTVQTVYPLSAKARELLDGSSKLKLTVKYYFLPSGRSIHTIYAEDGSVLQEGGVEPHIRVEPKAYPGWVIEEIERIRGSKKVVEYVEDHFEELEQFVRAGDRHDTASYPGFDALVESLDTKVDGDVVRRIIRFHLRRKIEDRNGKEFAGDFHEDTQLQRGILEVLDKLDRDPATAPQYAWLKADKKKVEEEPEKP